MKAEELKIEYYGTDLSEHGHYYWDIHQYGMYKDYRKKVPFVPYQMVPQTHSRKKGAVQFQQIEGYSILGIEGSCVDSRGGTVSVFWVKGLLTKEELTKVILGNPIIQKMFEQMDFTPELPLNL